MQIKKLGFASALHAASCFVSWSAWQKALRARANIARHAALAALGTRP
jgi:hypothetical protein